MASTTGVDRAKLKAFLGRAVNDLAAGYGGVMVSLGHRLGLYGAMAGAGPIGARELAARTGCAERYVTEWLGSQVAGGYVAYHAASGTYELTPEQAMVLADPGSAVFIPNAWSVVASMWLDEEKTVEAFRTGKGVSWGEHHHRLHRGVAAFARNVYRAHLVPEWLPALDGVVARLERGIAVADVGCGQGDATLLMAEAFPRSRFHGFDAHAPSVEQARRNAEAAELADRATFDVARATDYPGSFDLICFLDSLHDMGDPAAAAAWAARALAPGGTVMLVEPFAHDRVEDNVSPAARIYYAASAAICCANAIAEGGREVLGAQAGEGRLRELFARAGFTQWRRAAETTFNLVFEVRR